MQQTLQFKNGVFKLMQIADTQENAFVNPDTIKLITLALEQEKPDLVVFTGDQLQGYSASFKGDTMRKIRRTIADLLRPLEDRGVPFCVTFGNHDDNCGISNQAQMELYASHKGFVPGIPRAAEDPGTASIQIKDSAGKRDVFALYLIDSGGRGPDGVYDPVPKERVDWYRSERDRLFAQNGRYVPALVFQHIPLPEYFDVIERVRKGTKGAVEAFYCHANEYYVLPHQALEQGDFMLESPASPDVNTGEFEAFSEKGDVCGVFVGHDHSNSFVLAKDGIRLGYTQGAGFNTYGPGGKRGVRVFTLKENEPAHFATYTVTMDSLCDYRPAKPLQEFVLSHVPTSTKQLKKILTRAGLAAAAAGALAIGGVLLHLSDD